MAWKRRVDWADGQLSGRALWLIVFVVVVGLLPSPVLGATEAPNFTRWPYVQGVTANSSVICWEADAPHSGTVSYGSVGSDGSDRSDRANEATTKELRAQCVSLSGLQAYTRYSYQVRLGDTKIVSGGSFLTLASSPQQPISFVAWGDHRTNHAEHRQLALKVKEAAPDLIIDVGDLVDNGFEPGDWPNFFNAERELLANAPVFPVLGNHELASPLYFSNFVLPGNGRWYSFDSGPVHFVGLDVVFSPYGPGSEQYKWLEQDLRNTSQRWKVVWMHYPAFYYSPGHEAVPEVTRHLVPLFERYGVQLVFSGHAHLYERDVKNGVNYIIAGGGGAPLNPIGKGSTTAYAESVYSFVKVAAGSDELTVTPTRMDGSQFDVFSLTLPAAKDPPKAPTAVAGTAKPTATPEAEGVLLPKAIWSQPLAWATLTLVVFGTTLVWLVFKPEKGED